MKKLCILACFAAASAFADERMRPAAVLLSEGYRPVTSQPAPSMRIDAEPVPYANLAWPVSFENDQHSIGNSMFQYQSYDVGEAYYHGGCDLRTAKQGEVRAPVTGKIVAEHYSYEVQADGSLQKYAIAWPSEDGDPMYFEVAILTADGYRFEIHHVDRATLTPDVVELLNQGGTIEAGTLIGKNVVWPMKGVDGELYHHVHYNIVTPDGVNLNPEALSVPLVDTISPQITEAYGLINGKAVALTAQDGYFALENGTSEIVAATTDQKNNDVYTQPPVKISLQYSDGSSSGWDFSQRLRAADGTWPALPDVYLKRLIAPDGRTLVTQGNYSHNYFLIRLKVNAGQTRAKIQAQDQAGNTATLPAP